MPLKTFNSDSQPHAHPCFDSETAGCLGITFHLPSRRRFIPYAWLLYAELNHDETELQLHYTHSLVTITGRGLRLLQEKAERFQLGTVRETSPSFLDSAPTASVGRIEITEKFSA